MSCCNSNCNHDPCGSSFNQSVTRAAQYAQYAQTQANKAEDLWLEFNALYLGAFAVAPTQDNEGNPLQTGALYFNSVTTDLWVWDGTAWIPDAFNEFTPFLATGSITPVNLANRFESIDKVKDFPTYPFLSTGSTTPRNLATRTADIVNVKDFGAVGDGIADDTAAIQNALNSGKALVFLPEGNYKITASITIPENVTLEGTLQPMTTGALWYGATSTWRIPTDASVIQVAFGSGSISQTNSAIRLQNNSCIRGISFYYPSQSFSSPSLYPPTISLKIIPTGDPVTERIYGIVIDSCHFCNPWIAIEFTEFHGRSLIRNLCGYAFKNFIYIDNGWEVNRLENIQLNPINTFYGNWPANYILNWQFVDKANQAFKIGKSDLCEIKDCFCFGFWTGINIGQFSTYQANGIFITNGGFEASARPVVLETNFRRIIFTNVQFGTAASTSGWNLTSANWPSCKAIQVFRSSLSTTPNEVKFVNCQVFRSLALAMDVSGCNDLSLINCGFYNSNSLDQGFSTQVVKFNNCETIKLLDNVFEQATNTNGNYANILSVNGFIVGNNTYSGQTKVSPAIFINTSTAGRLNNNIENGTLSQGVVQAGSTDVVSTNFVQY